MTLAQLESLDDMELALILYIINNVYPVDIPKMQFEPRHLTWFRKGVLEERIQRSFPLLEKSAHPVFSSLLNKLGVAHEIRYEQPVSGSV